MIIGAHLSAGDSVLEAGKAAKELGLEAVQLFLTSPVQLQKMEIDNDEAREYRRLYGYLDTVVHGPFTLNPANPSNSTSTSNICFHTKYCTKLLGLP